MSPTPPSSPWRPSERVVISTPGSRAGFPKQGAEGFWGARASRSHQGRASSRGHPAGLPGPSADQARAWVSLKVPRGGRERGALRGGEGGRGQGWSRRCGPGRASGKWGGARGGSPRRPGTARWRIIWKL